MSTETEKVDRLDGDSGINVGPIDSNVKESGPASDTLNQPVVSETVNSGLEDETMATASTSVNAVKLDDNNYDQWSLVIENVLRSNGLWPYVLGKVVKPPEDYSSAPTTEKWVAWDSKDSKAKAIILCSLDTIMINVVRDCETSKIMWDRIKDLREPKTSDILTSALTMFFSMTWPKDESVSSFLSNIAVIQGRISACAGDKIKCMETLVIAKTLSTLPPEYSSFVQVWNQTADSDPKLDDFRSKLLVAERAILNLAGEKSDPSTKAGSALSVGMQNKKQRNNAQFKGKCHFCKATGHKEADCRKKKAAAAQSGPKTGNKEVLSASCALQAKQEDRIVADSGAGRHITRHLEWFSSIQELADPIDFGCADQGTITAEHSGTIEVEVSVDGISWKPMTWSDVLYIPNASSTTMFSTGYMDQKGYGFKHENGRMLLTKDGKAVLGGIRVGNTFLPHIRVIKPKYSAMAAHSMDLWHQRLGHVSDNVLKIMARKGLVDGLELSTTTRSLCDACHMGKQTSSIHPSRGGPRDCEPGQRWHTDVGFMSGKSLDGYTMYIVFKDEVSAFRRVYFMSAKEQVPATVKAFIRWAEIESGRKVVSIRTDNGSEYVNHEVDDFFEEHGISHERSPAYVKQANGMAERENRTLADTMRSLLHNTNLSEDEKCLLWVDAMALATYIRNRVLNRGRTDVTPFELFYGKKPNVASLRIFGSPAFVKVPEAKRRKIDPKSTKMIFIGFDSKTDKILRVYDRTTKSVKLVSDVIVDDIRPEQIQLPLESVDQEQIHDSLEHDYEIEQSDQQSDPSEAMDKRGRGRPPSSKNKPKGQPTPHPMKLRGKGENQMAMFCAADPSSYHDAVDRPDAELWKHAMDNEMQSHVTNGTWTLVPLPTGSKTVSCKWVFRSKQNPDGTLARRKARLVARGFSQKAGVDYSDTFSPVVQSASVRIVLALAANLNMDIVQFDVKTAFLHGQLNETVYMDQPEGYERGNGLVCLLKKSLYGLKQAPRTWFETFDKFLDQQKFKAVLEDPCVYRKDLESGGLMLLCLYVDDGLVCSTSSVELNDFMTTLRAQFEITCDEPSCYIGMELKRDRKARTISISQKGYLIRILERFGMLNAKPIGSPLQPGLQLIKTPDDEDACDCPYLEALGSLNYASGLTRPDITFAVNQLQRFGTKPSNTHWTMVKRVMRYLRGTLDYSLVYGSDNSDPVGYCDSDFAGDSEERRSTSGFVFKLFGGPIVWRSELQEITAVSVAEAEYVSMAEALKQSLWIRPFLVSIGHQISKPTMIFSDNQAAIALSQNPEFKRKTKHIGARFHRIRQEQRNGLVTVDYVPTKKNPADCLTKALGPQVLQYQIELLNIVSCSIK